MNRAQSKWVIGAALLALLVSGVYVWRTQTPGGGGVSLLTDERAHDHAPASASPASRSARKHTHAISAALQLVGPEYVEMSQRWFEPPVFNNAQKFADTATRLAVDPSCANRAEMRHATLETSIRNSVGVDTSQSFPTDALVQQLSQFWQQEGWFHQISVTWDKDIPATYRLEHFRSPQADFHGGVERIALRDTGTLDALIAATRIDDAVNAAESRGAKRGARVAHLLLGGEEGDSLQDLKLVNGRPVAWMFGYGHCRLRNDGMAHCRCVDPATATEALKQEHRVID